MNEGRALLLCAIFLSALALPLTESGNELAEEIQPSETVNQWTPVYENRIYFDPSNRTDLIEAIAPGQNGDVWVGGTFCSFYEGTSDCSYSIGNFSHHTNDAFWPAFLGRIDEDGNWLSFEAMFGDLPMTINVIEQMANGDLMIGGSFNNGNVGGTAGFVYDGYQIDSGDKWEAFLMRVDANGSFLWAKVIGGGFGEEVNEILEAPDGSIYVSGLFCGTAPVDSCYINYNGTRLNSSGHYDIFISKYDANGTFRWASAAGSPVSERAYSLVAPHPENRKMAIHPTDGIFLTSEFCKGQTVSNCNLTSPLGTHSHAGLGDSFIAHIDGNGTWQQLDVFGGGGIDEVKDLAVRQDGKLVLVGRTNSWNFTLDSFSFQPLDHNPFLAVYDHLNGTFVDASVIISTQESYFTTWDYGPRGEVFFNIEMEKVDSPVNHSLFGGMVHQYSSENYVSIIGVLDSNLQAIHLDTIASSDGQTYAVWSAFNSYGDLLFAPLHCFDQNSANCAPQTNGWNGSTLGLGSMLYQISFDADRDTIYDDEDDCPNGVSYWTPNATTDFDGDGCRDSDEDTDDDNDGFADLQDACHFVVGTSIHDRMGCPDADGDGYSDAGDVWPSDETQWADADGDDIGDNYTYEVSSETGLRINPNGDAVPADAEQWLDQDGDGWGDNESGQFADDCNATFGNSTAGLLGCPDMDGDGWADLEDDLPAEPTQHQDGDGDGFGESQSGITPDACPSEAGDSFQNQTWGCPDADGDGWADFQDHFPNDEEHWNDTDGDGYSDHGIDDCPDEAGSSVDGGLTGCPDADGDGWADRNDAFIDDDSQWQDVDGDGYGDNPEGANPDDCYLTAGASYLDLLGCADYDGDGWSSEGDAFEFDATQWLDSDEDGFGDNTSGNDPDNCPSVSNPDQTDFDEDGMGDACDDDDDEDGVYDVADNCPTGEKYWTSSELFDYDLDGCKDATEDDDDDGDGVLDADDLCKAETTNWASNEMNDHDGDGCNDDTEDADDDNDGIRDAADQCPYGATDWSSTASTDHDGDGCKDSTEDSDDDNDGLDDHLDSCPVGYVEWIATGPNDINQDGCLDGRESAFEQGTGEVDFSWLNQNEEDDRTFGEKLAEGDLDAIGLVLAILLPLLGISITLFLRARKQMQVGALEASIENAESETEIDEIMRELRKAVRADLLTQARYQLMKEEALLRKKELARPAKQKSKRGPPPKKKPPAKPVQEAKFSPPEDAEFSTGDDGYTYYEAEDGQWWYRAGEDDDWKEWQD